MKYQKLVHLLCGLAVVLLAHVAAADDTDIYMSPGASLPPGSEPMVMFSLDYRPNLGSTACNGNECDTLIEAGYLPAVGPYTFFDVLRAALKKVMEPLEGLRVGLMLNHNNESDCIGPKAQTCSNGAYIAMGVRSFLKDDANAAKAEFHSILASIPVPQGNMSHAYQGKELFFEMFRYLTGQGIYNAHNGWTDYSTDRSRNLNLDGPGYDWDTAIESGNRYLSPLSAATACTNIFTVNPLFFVANQDDDSDPAIETTVDNGGFGVGPNDFADVVRYLNDVDLASGRLGVAPELEGKQNVTSYFLVDPTKINKTTIEYAVSGGTGAPLPLSGNPDELVTTLQSIFHQILSVSTTFVAASAPINVFNRAEIVNNVYIALFQVDQEGKPAWRGNLKKLRVATLGDTALLLDALDDPAVATDGRIRTDALTFWTQPAQLPPPDTAAGEVAGRDGRSVARGGAGQRLPGYLSGGPGLINGIGTRKLFYDRSGSLAALNADAATASELQAALGAADAAEAQTLIAFARGVDVDDLDNDANRTEARGWIFYDPLHSQPLPLNYGARAGYTEQNPAIYLAIGSNDGFLRFVRNTDTAGAESGVEAWAFMPRSTMRGLATLRANGRGTPHPYAVDGAPAAYIEDLNNNGTIETGERAYLYFGLRRGGKEYYAIDVSDPENPRLMWSISKEGDFAELGYTFSTPRVGHLDLGNGPQPVLAFAGGYDLNKDARGTVGTDDSEGNAIFVVDAETGALIWKARGGTSTPTSRVFEHADLVDSIPSELAAADTDGDLLLDRLVVGDTGGNVWRADIAGSDTRQWKLTRLAALGRHAEGGKINDRRFFHRPDIVPTEDRTGLFDAVLIGSGDRPDPLDQGGLVTNYFYMLKDRNVGAGAGMDVVLTSAELGDVTDNCLQEGGSCSVDLVNGWKLALESPGEKALATPITIAGTVFFTTYIPAHSSPEGTCAPAEGSGRLYSVSLQNASAVINYNTSDDNPLHPDEPSTSEDRFTDLNSPGIPSEVVLIPPDKIIRPDLQIDTLEINTRWRTFWYLGEDSDL